MSKNTWNKDTHIVITNDDEAYGEVGTVGEIIIHGVEGEVDKQITLEEIKACAKYFTEQIGDFGVLLGDAEYGMAMYLSFKLEAIQRGGKLEVNMLDSIPIMHKWVEMEALKYLHTKLSKKLGVKHGKNEP